MDVAADVVACAKGPGHHAAEKKVIASFAPSVKSK
jgi:hypothetical protein